MPIEFAADVPPSDVPVVPVLDLATVAEQSLVQGQALELVLEFLAEMDEDEE